MKKLKTKTMVDICENPLFSICFGHVTVKDFNKAHRAEGWVADPITKDEIYYSFAEKTKNGYRLYTKNTRMKNPIAVTVMDW